MVGEEKRRERESLLGPPVLESSGTLKVKVLVAHSCPTLCNPTDCRGKVPLSMEFSRQKYWSGQPFPSPGDLPNPGIEPRYPTVQMGFFTSESPGKLMLPLTCSIMSASNPLYDRLSWIFWHLQPKDS